jgi:hypothetical protein
MANLFTIDGIAELLGATATDPKFDFGVVYGRVANDARKAYGDFGTPYYGKGPDGREYFLPVTLNFNTSVNIPSIGVTPSYDLPYPVISIKASKNFIDTPLVDRHGSVTEYTHLNNYEITVTGFLATADSNGKRYEFPEDHIKDFAALWVVGEAMELRCAATDPFLSPLGGMVTLRSFDIPENKGVTHVRMYRLAFQSDSIFNLTDIS